MKILICNVGSTSLKYKLFDMDNAETVLASGRIERVGAPMGHYAYGDSSHPTAEVDLPIPDYAAGIGMLTEHLLSSGAVVSLDELDCVGFKVVHAKGVTGVQLLDERVLSAMADFNTVAPSHNPPYIAAIRQFRRLLPNVPCIGSFETGFHAELPPEAYLYSIPKDVSERYAIRRYGFHGASHEYVSGRVNELLGRTDTRVITCHLGGSGSLCAVKNGKSIDTNLGLSLQCGVFHNNRCGDLDPYILLYLMKDCGYTVERIEQMLNRESGMLGLSRVSNDLRDVEQAADAGNEDAKIAIEAYCYAVKKQIGAYLAALGGADAIAFAGGIGERSARVREKVLSGLGYAGILADPEKNRSCRPDAEISAPESRVKLYVIATDEEIIVARKAKQYLNAQRGVTEGTYAG